VEIDLDIAWGSAIRGTRGTRRVTRSVELPAGAARRLPFVVPLEADARSLTVSVRAAGATLGAETVDLRGLASTDRFTVAVSSDISFDALAGLSDGAARVVYPRVDDLPEAWAGYDGVEMVIVHDTSSRQLSARQAEALAAWVATGGTLVFTGGTAALQHAAAGLTDLLPVEVTGISESQPLAPLSVFAGVKAPPRGNAVTADVRLTAGAVLAGEPGRPLIVKRGLGRGTVWFLSFDPAREPLSSWEGMLPLWRVLAGRGSRPTLETLSRGPGDDRRLKVMLGSPPAALPSVLGGLAFAVGYLALLAMLIGVARLRPRTRTLLLVGLPVLGCLCAWLVFGSILLPPAPRILSSAAVALHSGDGVATVTERIGIIASRPGRGTLSWASRQAAVDEATAEDGLTLVTADHSQSIELDLSRFAARLLIVKDVIPFDVEARLESQDAPLEDRVTRVLVTNAGQRPLLQCFLWKDGRGFPIGDIAPGKAELRTFTSKEGMNPKSPGDLRRLLPDARHAALWAVEAEEEGGRSPVVYGWLAGSALPVSVTGAEPAPGRPPLSLVMVETR
jgi:hypothetical protein